MPVRSIGYCENADSTLGKSIADAEAKIPQVASAIEEAAASKKQLEAELQEAQVTTICEAEAKFSLDPGPRKL